MNVKDDYEVAMCHDCAMFHANGELPDSASDDRALEISNPRGLTDSDTGDLFSCVVVVTGEESFFSMSSCDLCEGGLGGSRVDGVVLLT